MSIKVKRLLPLAISAAVVGLIVYKIRPATLGEQLGNVRPRYLALAFLLLVPQYIIVASRWKQIVEGMCRLNLSSSLKLALLGSTLNIIVPSRLGDFAKAVYHRDHDGLDLGQGVFFNVVEKLGDLLALSVFTLLSAIFMGVGGNGVRSVLVLAALLLAAAAAAITLDFRSLRSSRPQGNGLKARLGRFAATWAGHLHAFTSDRRRLVKVTVLSMGAWLLQLAQFHLIALAFGVSLPTAAVYGLVPVAILAGLVPVSLSGIGTRDLALIYLLSPYAAPATIAAAAMMYSVRYVLPALAGIPFLGMVSRGAAEEGEETLEKA